MGLLGRKVTGTFSAVMFLAGGIVLYAQAEGNYALSYDKPESGEYYMLLPAQAEKYEVSAGDSLWKISKKLWGDGRFYPKLYEINKETVSNPDLIYPGQILKTTRPFYLEGPGGVIEYKDVFRYSEPYGCTMGLLSTDDIGASCVLYGHDEDGANYDIACMIREREPAKDCLNDYAAWEKAVREYAEEWYGDSVQNLMFEEYLSQDEEPVYLYSYVYEIDLSRYEKKGNISLYVCAGVKQTTHMQVEFVGFGEKNDYLRDRVRYVLASFEELLPGGAACTVNENNIVIYPDTEWDAASFNTFAWIEQYFDAGLREVTGYNEKQKSNKEQLLNQMREGKDVYGGKKKAGN